MTVEPGRQLAGRYRVEDLLAERAGARLWRAVDEVLRRSVAIDVLPSDSARASALVQAARRSAVVTDGRFLRVLDAAEENGDVYVVREWAPGESLDLVLAEGPLPHRRAAWVVHEVAEAVSVAHSAGIYHLRLTPQNILVTDTGGVKIIGLATDAALHGARYADAEAEDVRALGRLLYACLVARWPEGPECGLPAAPFEHGRMLRPGQVRAGVPKQVEEVCDRILGEPPRHHAEPLRHASAVATELDATVRLATDAAPYRDPEQTQAAGIPVRGPQDAAAGAYAGEQVGWSTQALRAGSAGPDDGRWGDGQWRGGQWSVPATPRASDRTAPAQRSGGRTWDQPDQTKQVPTTTAPIPTPARGGSPRDQRAGWDTPPAYHTRRRRGRAWLWVGVVLVVAALAAASFYLGLTSSRGNDRAAGPTPNSTSPASNLHQPVRVASVSTFDPFGEAGENDEQAPLVLDGDPSTQWTTLSYEGNPKFGGLKPGLGLVLDLGRPQRVSRVALDLGGSGTDLQVRTAARNTTSAPSSLDGYTPMGSVSNATGRTVVRLDRPVTTRYVLVWLTRLPPESGGTYRGFIGEIGVQG